MAGRLEDKSVGEYAEDRQGYVTPEELVPFLERLAQLDARQLWFDGLRQWWGHIVSASGMRTVKFQVELGEDYGLETWVWRCLTPVLALPPVAQDKSKTSKDAE